MLFGVLLLLLICLELFIPNKVLLVNLRKRSVDQTRRVMLALGTLAPRSVMIQPLRLKHHMRRIDAALVVTTMRRDKISEFLALYMRKHICARDLLLQRLSLFSAESVDVKERPFFNQTRSFSVSSFDRIEPALMRATQFKI